MTGHVLMPNATAVCFAIIVTSFGVVGCSPSAWGQRPLAFPEAEGAGAFAAGGRGGRVIAVTNLNDQGPGSLRDAVKQHGPRIVVFQVAGIIDLKSPLDISNPFLTVSGHTAPGDGVCLRAYGIRIRDTHDIVLHHLRVRPGSISGKENDALLIYRSQNVVVDHCSLSWSVDEVLDVSDDWHAPIEGGKTDNVTIQWCILSESLRNSIHAKGTHGYAALVSAIRDGDVTLHHNLFAHHVTRVPRPGGRQGEPGLRLEFRHNVIYDWGSPFAGYSSDSDTAASVQMHYVANYLKPGPSTPQKGRGLRLVPPAQLGSLLRTTTSKVIPKRMRTTGKCSKEISFACHRR